MKIYLAARFEKKKEVRDAYNLDLFIR